MNMFFGFHGYLKALWSLSWAHLFSPPCSPSLYPFRFLAVGVNLASDMAVPYSFWPLHKYLELRKLLLVYTLCLPCKSDHFDYRWNIAYEITFCLENKCLFLHYWGFGFPVLWLLWMCIWLRHHIPVELDYKLPKNYQWMERWRMCYQHDQTSDWR